MYCSRQILTVFVVSMLVIAGGRCAFAQPRRGGNPMPPQDNSAVQTDQAAKDATSAQSKADDAKKAVSAANDAVHAAQKDIEEATKALRKIEEATIDAQPDDSEFGKARDAYRAAEKKYQDARKSVLDDDSFKTRLAAARESEDSAEEIRSLRKEFDEMPVIADSRSEMQAAKEAFEPLKPKLFSKTSAWVSANDDLKAKKAALDDANHKFTEATVALNKAKAAAARERAAALAAKAAASRGGMPMQPQQQRGGGGRGGRSF